MRWISNKNRKSWHPLYKKVEPCAELIKIVLQMAAGIVIVYFIGWKLLIETGMLCRCGTVANILSNSHPLEIVAYGLGISAGFELAYMLFTPGPDEALDPLIMGLASSVLLLIAKATDLTWQLGVGSMFIIIGMGILLYFRNKIGP